MRSSPRVCVPVRASARLNFFVIHKPFLNCQHVEENRVKVLNKTTSDFNFTKQPEKRAACVEKQSFQAPFDADQKLKRTPKAVVKKRETLV